MEAVWDMQNAYLGIDVENDDGDVFDNFVMLTKDPDYDFITFVAEFDGRVIGYSNAQPLRYDNILLVGETGCVQQATVVLPEFRNMGIAELLGRRIAKRMAALGYERMMGNIHHDSVGHNERAGWTIVPEGYGYGSVAVPVPAYVRGV